MKKIVRASIVGLSILTTVPNVTYKQPKAMFKALKSFFGIVPSPNGLPNSGVTCYFNSMIQALSTSQTFRTFISQQSSDIGQTNILNDLFLYIDNAYTDLPKAFNAKVISDYNNLVEMCRPTAGQRSPSETLTYLKNNLAVPAEKLPEEIDLDINGNKLFQIEATEADNSPIEAARSSYLYHWNRLTGINSDYNTTPVCICSKIEAPTPGKETESNNLSNDFKLKCIICYIGNGVAGHYYVVREHAKNWFEISDDCVKLAVKCEGKSENEIITELNEKYNKQALMAFYDYDPDYKIGV